MRATEALKELGLKISEENELFVLRTDNLAETAITRSGSIKSLILVVRKMINHNEIERQAVTEETGMTPNQIAESAKAELEYIRYGYNEVDFSQDATRP